MYRGWCRGVGFQASAAAAKPIELKAAPIYDCIAASQETMKAVCLYQMQFGHYPRNLAVLQIRHTHCPISGKEYAYKVSADGQDFVFYCSGKIHRSDGARPDHPWFSMAKGFQVR